MTLNEMKQLINNMSERDNCEQIKAAYSAVGDKIDAVVALLDKRNANYKETGVYTLPTVEPKEVKQKGKKSKKVAEEV